MLGIRITNENGNLSVEVTGAARAAALGLRDALTSFAGLDRRGMFWSRWLFLRILGVAFMCAFAGFILEGPALFGPAGLEPIADVLKAYSGSDTSWPTRLLWIPSLFWVDAGEGAIRLVAWAGLAASLALTANLWPRLALFACWLCFLSFLSATIDFSPSIIDNLLAETALVALPLAPGGIRPGLGLESPPAPLAVFAARFLAFRVMCEAGWGKIVAGSPIWHDMTLLDSFAQYAPLPTVWSFYDHFLPHPFHVFQMVYTLVAEFGSSMLCLFSRPGRLIALFLWVGLQSNIMLRNDFGWLNMVAVGLGALLIDDELVAWLARAARLDPRIPRAGAAGRLHPAWLVLMVPHLAACTALFTVVMLFGPGGVASPIGRRILALPARVTSVYMPFASPSLERRVIEISGSNDFGRTWRPYPYRFLPQNESRMAPTIAPYFTRFDATMFLQSQLPSGGAVVARIAGKLLESNREVIGLFAADPFAGVAPQAIRAQGYDLKLGDWAGYRSQGKFWSRTLIGDLTPVFVRDPLSGIVKTSY